MLSIRLNITDIKFNKSQETVNLKINNNINITIVYNYDFDIYKLIFNDVNIRNYLKELFSINQLKIYHKDKLLDKDEIRNLFLQYYREHS